MRWLPVARDYPGAEVLNWKDLSPRPGVAYDLFGTGCTAFKFSLSRYALQEGGPTRTRRSLEKESRTADLGSSISAC